MPTLAILNDPMPVMRLARLLASPRLRPAGIKPLAPCRYLLLTDVGALARVPIGHTGVKSFIIGSYLGWAALVDDTAPNASGKPAQGSGDAIQHGGNRRRRRDRLAGVLAHVPHRAVLLLGRQGGSVMNIPAVLDGPVSHARGAP